MSDTPPRAADPRYVSVVAKGGALIASSLVFIALQVGADTIAGRFAEGDASARELVSLLRIGALFVPLFALTQVVRYCTQAASLVAILAAGNLFYAGTGPTGLVLSMTGRPGINFVNSAVAVALYIGLGRRDRPLRSRRRGTGVMRSRTSTTTSG